MKWTSLLAAPAGIVLIAPATANVYLTVEQAKQAIFPGTALTPMSKSGWFRTVSGGYFIVDRVLGKHEYITYAVGINSGGTIKQIEILEYNESYGYEVREAGWRSQFVGKTAASPLQLNVDIKNISGATLSSKHITDGVRRIVQALQGQ